MKRTIVFIALELVLLLVAVSLYAQAPGKVDPLLSTMPSREAGVQQPSIRIDEENMKLINKNTTAYTEPANKMGTGIVNVATGWADVPKKISDRSAEQNPLAGLTIGFGEGVVTGVARTTAGALDVAMFSIPPYDAPLMESEYKVSNPNEGFKIDLLSW
ncbi:MAG: exosortase system-associated protein, TIGR04073 family [Candidatus Omnitrophota bacterium]